MRDAYFLTTCPIPDNGFGQTNHIYTDLKKIFLIYIKWRTLLTVLTQTSALMPALRLFLLICLIFATLPVGALRRVPQDLPDPQGQRDPQDLPDRRDPRELPEYLAKAATQPVLAHRDHLALLDPRESEDLPVNRGRKAMPGRRVHQGLL
jgi:hypothetical protein